MHVTKVAKDWNLQSWQSKNVLQQANYPDQEKLDAAVKHLGCLPPLVTSWEVNALKAQLADAQQGNSFLLQGGDCAERFADCEAGMISNRLKVLLQMSLVLVYGLKMPVVRVGRMAGQYAKPRSADTEVKNGVELPSYRGDLVNGPEFTEQARIPDPQRLIVGHARSAMTLNFIRGLIDGGFADLHHPEYWDLDWVGHSPLASEYQEMVDALGHSLSFMEVLAGRKVGSLQRVDFFTSHEALHLHYEMAQTRKVPHQTGWYNLSTHLPWIGMRTAQLDGGHIEYCRGIQNPVGIKIAAKGFEPDWLSRVLDILNPDNEKGKIILIHRLGADGVEDALPAMIKAVQNTGKEVLWCSDPMHGNTESTSTGRKTRHFDNIRKEVEACMTVHQQMGTRLGGVHLELTGENVTECVGGARGLKESDLERAYLTEVDPRLNYEQALEMAMLIVKESRTNAEFSKNN
ncbi:MAG: class II 3-deoxy-7-phosphoheptulonate synthase [bacterium]